MLSKQLGPPLPESLRDGIEVLDVGRKVSTNLAQLRVVPQAESASC